MTDEPFSVRAALDHYVASIEIPREPDGKWHPSSLGSCDRKAVYEFRGIPKTDPRDERSRRVLRVGHIFHNIVQDAVEAHPTLALAFREVPIEWRDQGIVGTADGLVQFDSGYWELQEFKTINSRSFKYNDLPKPEHVIQVTPYMQGLRLHGSLSRGIPPLGDMLTRARITYISKDDLEISEHIVLWTDAKEADIAERIARLNNHREGPSLPPRMPIEKGKRFWLCGYCEFATRCWDIDTEGQLGPDVDRQPDAITD